MGYPPMTVDSILGGLAIWVQFQPELLSLAALLLGFEHSREGAVK